MTDANPTSTPQSEGPVDPLSDRQRAFVDAYLIHRNAAQAAREAGYSEKTAKQAGSRLLAHPDVRAAVTEGLAQLAADAGVKAEWVIGRLKQIASSKPGDEWRGAEIVRATELLARHLGMFTDKVELTGKTLEEIVLAADRMCMEQLPAKNAQVEVPARAVEDSRGRPAKDAQVEVSAAPPAPPFRRTALPAKALTPEEERAHYERQLQVQKESTGWVPPWWRS